MPKKAALTPVERARKQLLTAVHRRIIAAQERAQATAMDRNALTKALRLSGVNLLMAIDDFEAAVRREYDSLPRPQD